MQPQGYLVLADGTDWFVQLHFTAVDVELLRFECLGDIFRRYRAEQMIVFADAMTKSQRDRA